MQVFDRDHQRLDSCRSEGPSRNCRQQPFALLIRRHLQRRIFGRNRQIHQRRDQRHRLAEIDCRQLERGFEAGETFVGALLAAPAKGLLQHVLDRVERRVLVERYRRAFDPRMRRVRNLFAETLNEARLSNSRLAYDQHYLSVTLARLVPAVQEQTQFVLPPDERCQPTHCRGSEPSPHSAWLDNAVQSNRMFNAFERLRALILDHEQPGDEMMHRRGYQNRVGCRGGLHPGRDVRHVAEHIRFLTFTLVDNDGAAMYADPRRKPETPLVCNPVVQLRDGIEDRETGEHRALRVVFVRLWVAEVDQQAVSQI